MFPSGSIMANRAGRHHPEEQGLKPKPDPHNHTDPAAGRHHPEEQGLKRWRELILHMGPYLPVGIIQKNKD